MIRNEEYEALRVLQDFVVKISDFKMAAKVLRETYM